MKISRNINTHLGNFLCTSCLASRKSNPPLPSAVLEDEIRLLPIIQTMVKYWSTSKEIEGISSKCTNWIRFFIAVVYLFKLIEFSWLEKCTYQIFLLFSQQVFYDKTSYTCRLAMVTLHKKLFDLRYFIYSISMLGNSLRFSDN